MVAGFTFSGLATKAFCYVLFVFAPISQTLFSVTDVPICMGMHTDLIIANPSDAKVLGEEKTDAKFKCKETSKLSLGHLVALQCILSKKKFTKELFKEYPLLFENSEEGPWVGKISDELVQLVSKVDDKDIPVIVKRWKEVKDDYADFVHEYPNDALEAGLKDLREFSKDAMKNKKSLLLRFW
jgi:hypothetical protein